MHLLHGRIEEKGHFGLAGAGDHLRNLEYSRDPALR
jgi:hypothetical protein